MQHLSNGRLARIFSAALMLSFFAPAVVFAAIPEPKSGGKFFQSKGTKAEENYQEQGRPGTPAYEWGKGLQIWQILLKPFVQYIAQWENNIFYDHVDTKDDLIHRLSAGVKGELPLNGGQHLLSGGFTDDSEWFDRFSGQDHNDYTFNGALDLNFVPFSLNVEDTHRRTVDRADTEFTTRVSREENTAHGLLEIPFAAFFLETEALNFNTVYRAPEDKEFDHNDFTIYQRAGLDISPKTQLLVEYGYENLDYAKDPERNGNANQVMLGLRGNWTDRITYQAWGGAQWRIYDDGLRPDFDGFVARSALQYDITDKSNVILKFNRDPQESTFDNQSFYVRNKGSLAWKQQIAERVFLNADGALSYNEYSRITLLGPQETTRRDYVWESGVGFEYLMPNDVVSIFGGYRYIARDSNFSGFSYGDNVLNVGVKASF